jgi:hypothetical protein
VAALAAHSGAEVIGITLQLYDHGEAVNARAHAVRAMTFAMRAKWPTVWALPIMFTITKRPFVKAWSIALPMII